MTVYYKMRLMLLRNATEVYYKMRQVCYYKMPHLLQNATILLQNATVITKYDVYYKLWQYKRGGVSIFYKDYLPVIRRDDLFALSE